MLDRELWQKALCADGPWLVSDVDFKPDEGRIDITFTLPPGTRWPCPGCGTVDQPAHDYQERTWRHLNFFQYKAFLHAKVPRINCSKCGGTKQVEVPWSRPGIGFTLLFEALVLNLATHMAVAPLARLLDVHPDSVWRILNHYVEKARQGQDLSTVRSLGIDEASRRKGHQYITTFCDLEQSRVLFVAESRSIGTIKEFVTDFTRRGADPKQIEEVCCDMSGAYQVGLKTYLPDAEVTFDRYHVMALVNAAVDEVRRQEQKETDVLKHSRYLFLKNERNLKATQLARLEVLKGMDLKTVRAYHLKVALQRLWEYKRRDFAEAYLKKWFYWATHSRLAPMKQVAYTIKRHWEGILRFIRSRITNGITEGLNGKIKEAAKRAYGFKTFENYRTIIYLVAGRLSLATPS